MSTMLLRIYLNDHLAGATGGVALSKRLAGAYRSQPDDDKMRAFADDVVADRQALIAIMGWLHVPRTFYKESAAYLGERLGRLKLNGALVHRSPLSTVLELELMTMGVTGKRSGWRALRALSDTDDRLDAEHLDDLLNRAGAQLRLLERLRANAVPDAFGPPA